jgi:lysozyme family protein
MADFDSALSVVLRHEGFSAFTNDPVDRGGATKWGITQTTLSAHRGRPASIQDVRDLSETEAREIYRRHYWERSGADRIVDQRVATKVFDIAVNLGVMRRGTDAAELLQRAVNVVRFGRPIAVDGIIGPRTIEAANLCEPDRLLDAIKMEQRHYYLSLIARDPSQERFRIGWLRRADWPKEAT